MVDKKVEETGIIRAEEEVELVRRGRAENGWIGKMMRTRYLFETRRDGWSFIAKSRSRNFVKLKGLAFSLDIRPPNRWKSDFLDELCLYSGQHRKRLLFESSKHVETLVLDPNPLFSRSIAFRSRCYFHSSFSYTSREFPGKSFVSLQKSLDCLRIYCLSDVKRRSSNRRCYEDRTADLRKTDDRAYAYVRRAICISQKLSTLALIVLHTSSIFLIYVVEVKQASFR